MTYLPRSPLRLLSNSAVVLLGDLLQKALGLAVVLLLSNYLDVSGFGLYAYIFAYVGFFSVFADFGLNQILVREISRDPEAAGKYIGSSILVRLVLAAVLYLSMLAVFYLLGESGRNFRLLSIAALSIFFLFGSSYQGFYQSRLRMIYPVMIRSGTRILTVGLLLGLMAAGAGLEAIIVMETATGLLGALVLVLISRSEIRPDFSVSPRFCRTLMREALPIAILNFCILVYFRIDVVMLAHMQDNTAVGLYSAANRLVEALPMIPAALMMSLFPLLSMDYDQNRASFERLFRKSMKFLSIIIAPIVVFVHLFSEEITRLLYRDSFSESASVLGILVIAQVFVYFNILFTNVFISSRRQKLISWVTVAMAFANVGLNLLLIPGYSFVGAAAATVITEILGTALALYLLKKTVNLTIPPVIWKVAAVALIYMWILSALDSVPFLWATVLAIVIYFPLVFATRILSVREVMEFRKNFAG